MQHNSYDQWRIAHPPPDLQELVTRWGDYWSIPDEAWIKWQDAMKRWREERKDRWLG
jgi:hypothetical protein